MADKNYSLAEALLFLGISRSNLYRLLNDPESGFPQPLARRGRQRLRWDPRDLAAFKKKKGWTG